MRSNIKDIAGERFGRLTVLRYSHSRKRYGSSWHCRCDCGAEIVRSRRTILESDVPSCGCYGKEQITALGKDSSWLRTHGQSKTPTYKSYRAMIDRCTNPKNIGYPAYGGKGIKVCDRWMVSFVAFLEDLGHRPGKDHTLDRIDVEKDYEPSNCRWANRETQSNNRRNCRTFEYRGRLLTLTQLADVAGLSSQTIHYRLSTLGWSVEDAVHRPKMKKRSRRRELPPARISSRPVCLRRCVGADSSVWWTVQEEGGEEGHLLLVSDREMGRLVAQYHTQAREEQAP